MHALMCDYERHGDLYIRGTLQEHRSPQVGPIIAGGRRSHRAWLERTCAAQLARVPPARRAATLDGLFAVTDILLWKVLRRDLGLPAPIVEGWMRSRGGGGGWDGSRGARPGRAWRAARRRHAW